MAAAAISTAAATAAAGKELLSLSELAAQLDANLPSAKPPTKPPKPKPRHISPEQSRAMALSSLEAALPSLDADEAALVARARA